jgi:hypothetical protein
VREGEEENFEWQMLGKKCSVNEYSHYWSLFFLQNQENPAMEFALLTTLDSKL